MTHNSKFNVVGIVLTRFISFMLRFIYISKNINYGCTYSTGCNKGVMNKVHDQLFSTNYCLLNNSRLKRGYLCLYQFIKDFLNLCGNYNTSLIRGIDCFYLYCQKSLNMCSDAFDVWLDSVYQCGKDWRRWPFYYCILLT